jgi:SAM-dependent methyltransferase
MEKINMYNTSKICDAADWFDPEIKEVIENELRESARLHRKQWEFAIIFLTLQKLGLLQSDKTGLSLGGGNERVLYSISKHIKKLFVTDLYDDNTSWDCARTTDPNEFIRSSKPFPIDDEKIEALRMDMRYLDFEDNSFDFCYSSCAIEHIGEDKDFLQHFNEVNRVLKDGGIYVLTTELQFGDQTIPDQNNFIFSKEHIAHLIDDSDLDFVFDVNAGLSVNEVNYPFPSNISNTAFHGDNFIHQRLFNSLPHLILLRGNVPFTSVLLVLKKSESNKKNKKIKFLNYEKTYGFLQSGVENYRKLINENKISFSPFSSLPDGVSRFYQDHSEFFSDQRIQPQNDRTIFHTDYFWLGNGKRRVEIKLKIGEASSIETNIIQIRIHSYSTYASNDLKCVYEKEITISDDMEINEVVDLRTEENFNYAFLCNLISENISCGSISIESLSIKEEGKDSIIKEQPEAVGVI